MSNFSAATQVRATGSRRRGLRWLTTFLVLLLVLGWVYHRLHTHADDHYSLTLTAGSGQGIRHQLAKTLAERSAERGITVTIQPTEGSEDALDKVDSGQVSAA